MNLKVHQTAKSACVEIAAEFAASMNHSIGEYRPTVCFPTGNTPIPLFQELISHYKNGTTYSKLVCFNIDEYYPMPPTAPESYFQFMRKIFYDNVDIDHLKTFILKGDIPPHLIDFHCADYEKLIASFGGIDTLFLGIGTNGHIGFNEPYSPFDSRTRFVELTSETRMANSTNFRDLDSVPRSAITMGLGNFMECKRVVLMAWGESKSRAIKNALFGEPTTAMPASILQEHPNLDVHLDLQAASRIF